MGPGTGSSLGRPRASGCSAEQWPASSLSCNGCTPSPSPVTGLPSQPSSAASQQQGRGRGCGPPAVSAARAHAPPHPSARPHFPVLKTGLGWGMPDPGLHSLVCKAQCPWETHFVLAGRRVWGAALDRGWGWSGKQPGHQAQETTAAEAPGQVRGCRGRITLCLIGQSKFRCSDHLSFFTTKKMKFSSNLYKQNQNNNLPRKPRLPLCYMSCR